MPKIFDNIENQLFEGLSDTLDVSHKADFCVGYFNLRGWKQVADKINSWAGGEGHQCRLLIGMQRRPEELVRELFSKKDPELIDNATAIKLRKMLAQEFKDQLTIGMPTEADEIGLRKLSAQIKSKKVVSSSFSCAILFTPSCICIFAKTGSAPLSDMLAAATSLWRD